MMGGGRDFNLGKPMVVACTVEGEIWSCRAVSRNCSSVGVTLALTRMLRSVGCRSATNRGEVNYCFEHFGWMIGSKV